MIDPQTAEIDAQGPFGGPEAAVAADTLRTSLDTENLNDVMVHIVRLHLPTQTDTTHHHRAPAPPHRT